MSRILRRPMFRGGRVDSRGTGITSGLMDEPRVEAQQGIFFDPLTYSAGMGLMSDPNLSMPKTPQRYLDTMDYINLTGSLIDRDKIPSMMGEAEVEEQLTAEDLAKFSEDIKDLTGATAVERTQKAKEEEAAQERRLAVGGREDPDIENARLQQEAYEKFKKQQEAKDVELRETEPATDAQSKEDATIEAYLKAIRGDDEPEINLEDLYADRLKEAKRGDIADILLGISAGALEEGTLTGAAKGAVEAARKTGKSEVLKDQIKGLETQMKIADRTGNIKQKRALEQILFAAKFKAGKEFELDRQLELLGPGLLRDKVKKAAYGATNLPEYLRNAQKDLDIGADLDLPTVITGAKIFAPDFMGTASSLEDIQSDGVYVIPEQKKVIRVKNAGTAQADFEEIAIF